MPRRKSSGVAALTKALKKATVAPRRRRPAGQVSGRGAYRTTGYGKAIGQIVGGALGAAGGYSAGCGPRGMLNFGSLGARMGGTVGTAMSHATGRGSYSVRHNSLLGITSQVPSVMNKKTDENSTYINHREYIGDVLSSTAFNIGYKLPINAAQPATFPWGSSISQNYQQYEIQGMLFEFISTSGDTTAGSQSLGEVMMATSYDSYLPTFTNKQQMLNQEFSCSAKPSVNLIHAIECAPRQTSLELLYTRTVPAPSNSDLRMWDLGQFYLATTGQQTDGSTLGELYVTYQIRLLKPLLASENVPTQVGGLAQARADSTFGTTLNGYFPLVQNVIANDLGITFDYNNQRLIFPPDSGGEYQVLVTCKQALVGGLYAAVPQLAFTAVTPNCGSITNTGVFIVQPSTVATGGSQYSATSCCVYITDNATATVSLAQVVAPGSNFTTGWREIQWLVMKINTVVHGVTPS